MYNSRACGRSDVNVLRPPTRLEARRPKPRANTEGPSSVARQSVGSTTENPGRSASITIKQEDQGGEISNPWGAAGKATKGAEWWRKP